MPLTFNTNAYIGSLRRRLERAQRNVQQVVAAEAGEVFSGVVEKTPVAPGGGRARSSWQLLPIDRFTWIVRSEGVPYILVLEYGGYPTIRFLTGEDYEPGPRTQRAPGGVPRMVSNVTQFAPQGMVRLTLLERRRPFQRALREAVTSAWRAA